MWVSLMIMVKLLIMVVVWMVMFSKNGQSSSNKIMTMGVGVIVWLESDKGGKGLTGEYGQLIMEYGMVATIWSVLAVFIMDSEKEKKGMEWVGLIVLAILGIIILIGATNLLGFKDVLTVYLAMEAHSLAFYTLASLTGLVNFTNIQMLISTLFNDTQYTGLLLGVMAVTMTLLFWGEWLSIINLAPFFHSTVLIKLIYFQNSPFVFSNLFNMCSLALMMVGIIVALNQFYIKCLLAYSAMAHVGYVLLALAVGSYTSIFSLLLYMILSIITSITIFTLSLTLFLFMWTRASFSKMSFYNLMLLSWKSFLPMAFKFNRLNLYWMSISKSKLVMQLLASTVSISAIIKALFYFQLHPYCIYFVSSTSSIYTFFLQLYYLLLAVSLLTIYLH